MRNKIEKIVKDWIPDQLAQYLPVDDLIDSIMEQFSIIPKKHIYQYAYVYKLTITKDNEEYYYIGSRRTDTNPEEDDYKGSPKNNADIWMDSSYSMIKEIIEIKNGLYDKQIYKKEHQLIKEYQKQYGVYSNGGKCLNQYSGRPSRLNIVQEFDIVEKKKNGRTIYSIAKEYKVDRALIYRTLKKHSV